MTVHKDWIKFKFSNDLDELEDLLKWENKHGYQNDDMIKKLEIWIEHVKQKRGQQNGL